MRCARLLICGLVMLSGICVAGDEQPGTRLSFAANESVDTWHGFTRHRFDVDGCPAWVIEPKKTLPGNPWSWCVAMPDAFADRCAGPDLLAKGFYHVTIEVGNTFGCPSAIRHMDVFYSLLVAHGFMKTTVLIGISRGGLCCYRFAIEDPQRVSVIYGNAAVCDFKSWPGGKVGVSRGSPGDWADLIRDDGFTDEAQAMAYTGNPIDILPALAKATVALIHVVGDLDTDVPYADNAAVVEKRSHALQGTIQVIHKPHDAHHPHGLDDPSPVVDFIMAHGSGQK